MPASLKNFNFKTMSSGGSSTNYTKEGQITTPSTSNNVVKNSAMGKCWIRDLKIVLKSSLVKKQMIFGQNWRLHKDDISIEVNGTKYLAALKDRFTIKLHNLTYKEIVEIVQDQYYGVEIWCGYRSASTYKIFEGQVIYVSNQKNDAKTSTCYILCGSNIVAKYGQARMSLRLDSGINLYSALKFILENAGIANSNVDEEFRNKTIKNVLAINETIGNWLDTFCDTNNFIVSVDSSMSNDITILDPYRTNNRIVKLDSDNFVLINGYPKVTSEGISMTLLPSFNFMPADVIQIDNSIIDVAATSAESLGSSLNSAMYMDKDGKYLIYQVAYNLSNRGDEFNVEIEGKARSLYSMIAGDYTYGQ